MSFEFLDAEPDGAPLPYEPHLSFTDRAWRKMMLYTRRSRFEIGGLGLVEQAGRDYVLTDLFIVEQDVNDIATRLNSDAVHRLLIGMLEKGDDPSAMKLWWHSHAAEGVFWSGEDEETIDRFRNDLMFSVVTNHRLQVLARLDYYDPRRTSWVWVNDPGIEVSETAAERNEIDLEIAAKTRHRPRGTTRIF